MLLPLHDDNPTVRRPYITFALIVLNLAITVWTSQLSSLDQQIMAVRHGFIPRRVEQLSNPNLVLQVAIQPEQRDRDPLAPAVPSVQLEPSAPQLAESVLTSMFLHAGWLHVLGNMWFLWIFGNNVEDRLGHILYLLFYLLGGAIAVGCHWAVDPSSEVPVIGASGAVSTILGAYAVTFPKAKVHTLLFLGVILSLEIPSMVWLGIWFVMELASAFFARDLGVAVWAHIGGFGAGMLLMPLLSLGTPPPGGGWHEEVKKHFSPPAQRVELK